MGFRPKRFYFVFLTSTRMHYLLNFILRYKNTLLYAALAFLALGLTVHSHAYHQSQFFNSSKGVVGAVYSAAAYLSSYMGLRAENHRLAEENKRLRHLLFNTQSANVPQKDTVSYNYKVIQARLIKNSFSSPRNYLTLNKGEQHGIVRDMGVITPKGVLGIVENTSEHFATVQSILNTHSSINAKIKNTQYFGSLVWHGKNYSTVQLIDVPRLVPLQVGDTIVTGGMSSIFPENIPIGIIKQYDLEASKSFYRIEVALFNDMTHVKNVYLIQNNHQEEIKALEAKTTHE